MLVLTDWVVVWEVETEAWKVECILLSKILPPTPDDDIIDLKYDQNVHDTIDMACFWLFGAISVKFDKINKKNGSFKKTSYYKYVHL